jgi:hypothetical protein
LALAMLDLESPSDSAVDELLDALEDAIRLIAN